MTILYYDCFSGISGDMNLGAMIDLGVDQLYLIRELKKLNVSGYTLSFETDQRKGITGTRADVKLNNLNSSSFQNFKRINTGSEIKNERPSIEIKEHGRSYTEIVKIIKDSDLSDNVKNISIEIFHKLGIAEAHIHGKSIDEIHFHEVGAVDAIVDIVGAAICFDFLKPHKIISSPVQMGGGMVKCAHGMFPVPAPATLEIMKDKPIRLGAVQVETTTPTGAAIITTLANEFSENYNLNIKKIGYGIGHRDNTIPNVLRVCLCELESYNSSSGKSVILECNIDDMNPELYGYIMDKLFDAGAEDVFFQNIMMKKNRPAIKLSVLCDNDHEKLLTKLILVETSTLGLRKYNVEKIILQRKFTALETNWGTVRIKHGYLDDILIKSKPEYDDCLKISKENNIPLTKVYDEIFRIINLTPINDLRK